jgi:hypothetical protein
MIRLKDYLSPSQYMLWKQSKNQYYKKYSLGIESYSNKFFEKGKELGKFLQMCNENPEIDKKVLAQSMSDDELLYQMWISVPTLDLMEDELNVVTKAGNKLKGFVDSANLSDDYFLEYKTGKIDDKNNEPWNQEKVNDSIQLKFYSLMYFIRSCRKTIPKATLIWIETIEKDFNDELGNFAYSKLVFTGRVESFDVQFEKKELLDLEKDIDKVIKEIENYEHKEIELSNVIAEKYIELMEIKEACEKEIAAIKSEVLCEMELSEVKYAVSDFGKFSISERKNWIYSDLLTNSMEESKNFFDKAKKLEQKDGSAKFEITESISFRKV